MRGSAWPAKGTVLEAALHHVADVVGVEGVVGELAGLADRRAGQRGIVGCLLQACRLEVVSEGLLQVALGRASGWPAGRRFPESCPRGMVWRPPCTESAGLSRMASAPHDGGQGRHSGGCFGEGNEGLGMVGRVGSGGGSFSE